MGYKFNPFTGNLDEVGAGGAGSTPGGSDTQVQFNDGGSFGGSADLTWDDSAKELGVGGDINLDDGGTYETTVQVVTPTANRTISFPDATGTVALVAGSSGQLTYNSAGAQAGLTSASIGSTGEINISLAGAASTPPVSFTGSWFTGGTATTTKPQLLIEPTGTTSTAWSTSGTGLGVNAASGFAGNLLDLQVNGTSQVRVDSGGSIFGKNGSYYQTTGSRYGYECVIYIDARLAWGNAGASIDLSLFRDAANTLAQRNGTNAQTFRVYNTYTDASNYERAKLEWGSNVFRIGTEAGSGGGTQRALEIIGGPYINFNLGSANKFGIGGTYNVSYQSFSFNSDNAHDIGTSSSGRPRNIYAATSITGPVNLQGTAPASASATGTAGDIRYDADYVYVCTATNTWKRAALATW